MKHRRTHTKRRRHSKRKTIRHNHRRRTHRRRGGLAPTPCGGLRNRFNKLKERVDSISLNTYEDVVNDIRNLHDEALRTSGCFTLAGEIDEYENTVLNPKLNALHQV